MMLAFNDLFMHTLQINKLTQLFYNFLFIFQVYEFQRTHWKSFVSLHEKQVRCLIYFLK